MDLSPEELDVSPPCFLVENSQTEESQQLCRSDSDPHITILKQLPIFTLSTRSGLPSNSATSRNELLVRLSQTSVPLSCPSGSGEKSRQGEPADHRGQQRNGGQEQAGGSSSHGGGGHGEDRRSGGAEGGYGGGGGDDGRGGGDDDENNDNDDDAIDDESPPAEDPSSSSSSDVLPSLVRPEDIIASNQWKDQKFTASEVKLQQGVESRSHNDSSSSAGVIFECGSGGSVHNSSDDRYSQASTRIVGEGADVAADIPSVESLSEASTAPVESAVEIEKKSSSSSSAGKSGIGSSGSRSSCYQGDLSSLSSGGSVQLSPGVRKHLPLHSMLRTQSTSDTSSSSAASKEDKICGKVGGYAVYVIKEGDGSEVCSSQEDMFADGEGDKEPVIVSSDLSADGSHIVPPKHHSTPTESQSTNKIHHHGHEKPLHSQVLMAKQRTSTPLEDGGFLPTPPSQGTPISNLSRFQSLQFSGEPCARETSSSSSDKVFTSSQEHSSPPGLTPSSPTAGEEESRERKSISSEERSIGSKHPQATDAGNADQELSEISKAASELLQSFDLSPTEQEHPRMLKQKETRDGDEVILPRWQQLQGVASRDSASNGKKSTSSNSSSPNMASSDDADKPELEVPQMHEWQSVASVLRESSSSSSEGAKMETAGQMLATSDKDPPEKVQIHVLVGESLSQSSLCTPVSPVIKEDCTKEAIQQDQSISPSSLAFDPFNADQSSIKGADERPFIAVGPTQPEMSEDMFRPSITQEGARQVMDIPADQPADQRMEEEDDEKGEDSQEIVFSLHLTQSQADVESQLPLGTSAVIENVQKISVSTVAEISTDVSVEKPAEVFQGEEEASSKDDGSSIKNKDPETIQREDLPPLSKQDSSSQSILAPLVQPQSFQPLHVHVPSISESSGALDIQEPQVEKVMSQKGVNVTETKTNTTSESERITRVAPHPSSVDVTVVTPPEPPILLETSAGVSSEVKDSVGEDFARGSPTTTQEEGLHWKPTKPRLLATIFSDTSSESGQSGGFHFSLPKQPLRPSVSTTPPPLRPTHHDTPDSQERGSRRSILPDVVLPVVSETPGMSSQAPQSSLDLLRPQSLTISMPRHGSPVSDSENTEPVFRFHTTLPPVATTPGTSDTEPPCAPEPPRSIFSRAREALAKSRKGEMAMDSEHDPFAFTAEDEDPEPVNKRRKTESPRRARETDIIPQRAGGRIDKSRESPEEDEEVREIPSKEQSIDSDKEHPGSAKPSSLQEGVSFKRMRQDESSGSGQSEVLGERSPKRARREDSMEKPGEKPETSSSEAVHYRQITHTRTVTTITTHVQRVVTVSIVDKDSGDVVEVLSYEEDDDPKVETVEKEKEVVHDFMESSTLEGSRVTLTLKSPKRQEVRKLHHRSSPRIKKPASSKTQTNTEKKKSGKRGLGETVKESGVSDHAQVGDQTVEIPTITRQSTLPVAEEELALQRTSSSDSSLTPGTRVLAKWLDGYFYPGAITTKQYKNGRYLVTFDDGDKRRIPRENIIVKDLLPAGQSVMAQGDFEDDFYEEGVIVGHYRDANERGYEIQTQNGAISRFPRSRVILSEQQAAAILSSESSFNVTSGSSVSIGAHSLRLRKDGSAGNSSTSPHFLNKSGSTESKDTSHKDTSGSSSDGKKRGKKDASAPPHSSPKALEAKTSEMMGETPKSTHKSNQKTKAQVRRAGQRISEIADSSSSDEQNAHPFKRRQVKRGLSAAYGAKSPVSLPAKGPSEPPTRRSPRKQMGTEADDSVTGAATANRNLFAGLAFLVTGVERERNEPDESDSESERIEFNRDAIKRQIETGGGVVLSSFPQSQISGAECFLISNRHQRTQKFFQSLASGIPCVSHMWINDSCSFNKRLDYKKYLLPAGESLEADGIVECRPRRNILGNMRVYLHGNPKFQETWKSVLLAAGCKMVSKVPNRFDYQCDVVISEDQKVPASVKHAADVLGIPIVSLEWLLQTLINGRQVPFDGHPKYDYRYKHH